MMKINYCKYLEFCTVAMYINFHALSIIKLCFYKLPIDGREFMEISCMDR